MRANDLDEVRSLIGRRNGLLHFIERADTFPRFVSIGLPTAFDLDNERMGEASFTVFIEGEREVQSIIAHAASAARENIKAIDKRLVELGVSLDMVEAVDA